MALRGSYGGVADPADRFESMRAAVDRLKLLERDHAASTPAGATLDHAVIAIRSAANLLTRQGEFFDASPCANHDRYARMVGELTALRSTLDELRKMALAYHPATPEARSL